MAKHMECYFKEKWEVSQENPSISSYFLEPCDPTPAEFNKRFWLGSHVRNKILIFSLKDTSKGDFIKCPIHYKPRL